MGKMGFKTPPELTDQKHHWKKELEKGGGKMNPARMTIKQGTWITSLLWSEYQWKEELKRNGITWQKFMELYSNCHHYFIGWAEGSFTWDNAIKNLIREIERESERLPKK